MDPDALLTATQLPASACAQQAESPVPLLLPNLILIAGSMGPAAGHLQVSSEKVRKGTWQHRYRICWHRYFPTLPSGIARVSVAHEAPWKRDMGEKT